MNYVRFFGSVLDLKYLFLARLQDAAARNHREQFTVEPENLKIWRNLLEGKRLFFCVFQRKLVDGRLEDGTEIQVDGGWGLGRD
jgi:hypothetical protein